jgi:hypothetical protein
MEISERGNKRPKPHKATEKDAVICLAFPSPGAEPGFEYRGAMDKAK